ncbi:MAG: hypothetical protein V1843_05255 [bacterium]
MKKCILIASVLAVLLIAGLVADTRIGHAALVVNTNQSSIDAQKNLSKTQLSLQTSFNRLSSGYRINSAKDDAAGLAITEKMKEAIRELDKSSRTVADGISLLQASDETMSDTENVLKRMRNLGFRTDANSLKEYESISAEVDRISQLSSDTSVPGIELINKRITEILTDIKAMMNRTAPQALTEKQYMAKIDAHLARLAKGRRDLAAYAAKIDADAQKVLSDAEEARIIYEKHSRDSGD